jgi:hypothetical protein
VTVALVVHARGRPATVEIRANETLVARVAVATEPTPVEIAVPGAIAREFSPLELTFRRARRSRFGRRGAVALRLLRLVVVDRAGEPTAERAGVSR